MSSSFDISAKAENPGATRGEMNEDAEVPADGSISVEGAYGNARSDHVGF
jgi:hypothetical protein